MLLFLLLVLVIVNVLAFVATANATAAVVLGCCIPLFVAALVFFFKSCVHNFKRHIGKVL